MDGAVESVGDFIQDEIIDPVKKAGSKIDDFVNEEIPGLGAADRCLGEIPDRHGHSVETALS